MRLIVLVFLILFILFIFSEVEVDGVAVILVNFACYIVALLNVGFGVEQKSEYRVFYSIFFILNFFLNLARWSSFFLIEFHIQSQFPICEILCCCVELEINANVIGCLIDYFTVELL